MRYMTLRASRSGTDGQQLSRVNNADYMFLVSIIVTPDGHCPCFDSLVICHLEKCHIDLRHGLCSLERWYEAQRDATPVSQKLCFILGRRRM